MSSCKGAFCSLAEQGLLGNAPSQQAPIRSASAVVLLWL